jgi:hypothetical protein
MVEMAFFKALKAAATAGRLVWFRKKFQTIRRRKICRY